MNSFKQYLNEDYERYTSKNKKTMFFIKNAILIAFLPLVMLSAIALKLSIVIPTVLSHPFILRDTRLTERIHDLDFTLEF